METTIRDILTDAIRYWERRRLAYNAILLAVVAIVFVLGLPESRSSLSPDHLLALFVLAVLANVAYCSAYIVDIVTQYSGFQGMWKTYRWVLFAIGVVFAAIIARFIAVGMFSNAT